MTQIQENVLSSVKNAIRILRSFKMDDPQKGVRELAVELGISKSSVQRILTTLATEGFVRKNEETNKYELGLSVLELSSIFLGHIDLHTEAMPIIHQLAEKCSETVHLAVLENLQVVYLCKVESEDSIELSSYTGLHNQTHCTSSGKLLLAYSEPHFVKTLLRNGLNKFTENTITNPEDFHNELEEIRNKGYSISKGELKLGITSISAPVRDYSGKVISAINLVGPSSRFTNQRIQYYLSELKQAAAIISENLGYWKR